MAAYAALVSLMNLIDQVHHHPQPPITLDKEQTQSLTEKIAFLQDFLEAYNHHYSNQEVERLRIRIAGAAYVAEDVIESHIVDQLLSQYRIHKGEEFLSLRDLFEEANGLQSPVAALGEVISMNQNLQKAIESLDYIKNEVEEVKEKLGTQEQLQRIITPPVVSSKSPSTQHNIMVGFEDILIDLLDKLTRQRDSPLQIIPISGMGGIGKTTLAKTLYANPLVEHHFHVLAWVTISQEYDINEILLEVLLCQKDLERESLSKMSEAKLREKLHKSLFGRRYFIVMDDMWSNDVWDKVKFYFPSNNEGSRIIITTRLSNVASYLSSGCGHEMDFLDQENSWSLFCKTVFGEEHCPPELEDVGMEIARNCKGLPLSIVVLGGLLAKSKPVQNYWEYILGNLSSIVNLEESERCFKILHTSYDELPIHLKVCFLYMGTFPEDSKIRVSELISMWVAEGFLKPITGKSLEESGEEYLMDLIDRNLILISERGYFEKIKFCNIHDLLRDLCIREAQKEKFVFFANQHDHEGINTARRIVIDGEVSKSEYLHTLQSASAARSLICNFEEYLSLVELRLVGLRLLRVFKSKSNAGITRLIHIEEYRLEDGFQPVNLRYVAVEYYRQCPIFHSSVLPLLWNLQTLVVSSYYFGNFISPEIWKMPLLRHVECGNLTLPDPPSGNTEEFVLHNLHTLPKIRNLKFGEEVIKRIPNVKKLELWYDVASDYCLNNIGHLYKLECLHSSYDLMAGFAQNIIFPYSLKELYLFNTGLSWEDINTKIGSLPHLQKLQLIDLAVTTSEWETTEGLFRNLKYLDIDECWDWKYWSAESTHFPSLEHLLLGSLHELKEIPCGIGDIPTLKSIELDRCSHSAIISAKQIAEKQEELGNESFQVTVTLPIWHYEGVESLTSRNFQVEIRDY